jgi:predicted porin
MLIISYSGKKMFKQLSALTILTMLYSNISTADVKLTNIQNCDILIGGEFGTEVGGRIQNKQYTKVDTGVAAGGSPSNVVGKTGVTANNKTLGMDSYAAAHTTVQNMQDTNFAYGLHIGVRTTTRSNQEAGESELDQSYIFLQGSKWGKLELGSKEGASRIMVIKGNSFDASEGTWDKYVSLDTYSPQSNFKTAQTLTSNFLTSPDLVFQESRYESNYETSRKITYYTPKISGFQAGISYIPDGTNKGGNVSFPNTNNVQIAEEKNALSAGITWEKSWTKDHTINIALAGEAGPQKEASSSAPASEKGLFNRAKAFILGAKYTKDKFSFATAYGNRGHSRFKQNLTENTITGPRITPKSSYFFNFGGAYKLTDKSSVSLTYLHSINNKNTFDLVYLGADYKIIEGFKTYAETSYFQGKQKRSYNAATGVITTNQNFKVKGGALITGIKLTF